MGSFEWASIGLEDWLQLIDSEKTPSVPDYCFPNEAVRAEYLDSIADRSEEEVRRLLRDHLLMPTGTLGADVLARESFERIVASEPGRGAELLRKLDFYRRLVGLDRNKEPTWQGLSWVLDLVPGSPLKAIDVIDAYLIAHAVHLPDGRIAGLADTQAVIRAMWIGNARTADEKRQLILGLGSARFEHLVEALYREMGFETRMTRRTRDGGRDVEITRDAPGQREVAHVECKLWTGPVGVTEVRNLLGVVSTELVSRGVLVTNSRFTEPARKLSEKDRRVELLDGDSLLPLLDQHLGADWSKYVDRVITGSMQRTGFPEQASPPAG